MSIRQNTENKVFSYLERHGMISPGQKILAGVSGGADSVCLLFVLWEYAKTAPVTLTAVYVDHGLRAEAGEDGAYVEELCRRLGVPFYLKKADVRGFAARTGKSLEEAGRELRYELFGQTAREAGAHRVAVAHSQNDRAETMLFHLFRGSALKGLCGILPTRGEIIRPLLCLEREEIEAYLRAREIPWRTDATNQEDVYTRNRIRHYILPFAESQVCRGAVSHMCKAAELLQETEDYLERQTQEAAERLTESIRQGDGQAFLVRRAGFLELHGALQKRLVHTLLSRLLPGARDITCRHVEDVLALFTKGENPSLSLPFGVRAQRSYEEVLLWREESGEKKPLFLWREVELPGGETSQPFIFGLGDGSEMEFCVFFAKKYEKVPRNEYTKWFDCDKIIKPLVLRRRQAGDYLTIADGNGGTVHKRLKDYLITEKIPRHERGLIPVLAEGSHILWLTGYRISEAYKVDRNTKRILQVKLLRGCADSGTEEKGV